MIDTPRGEFPSFSQLRYAYIQAFDEHPPVEKYLRVGGWDPDKLHISKLGACRRQQMLQLSGAPKRLRSVETLANEQLMFWQGNMIHALTAGALDWAEVLVAYEEELPRLPEGWTGHFDCIYHIPDGEYVCWDGKSVRQNAFDYAFDWPKTKDCMQMGGYLAHLKVGRGEIEYIDRGGSNRPVLCFVPFEFEDRALAEMTELDRCRAHLPELPEVLPKVYTASYYKVRGADAYRLTGVKYGTSWECGWCDYLHGFQDKKTKLWTIDPGSPCKPQMVAPDFVAKLKDGRWQIDPEHQEGVEGFLAEQVAEWSPEEDPEALF